jgi:two-component system, LytTR family, sensor histidine kinase AlgZ
MHPILARPRQLGLYLLAWIPLAGILAYLLAGTGDLSWREAVALTVPLCVVYAFVCLSAWYPCRVTPLERSSFARLAVMHLTAAVLLSTFWIVLAKILSRVLTNWPSFAGLDQRLARYLPLLSAVGILLYLMSVTFHYVLLAEQASREAQARALEARVLARDAELKALRAQVNPHFLFNCLHSISALTATDAGKAREMCILLADFLRTTLRLGSQQSITLEQELSLVHGYLAIEKVRFGQRLQLEEEVVPQANGVLIPPLLLQPLVENAIRHGIANLTDGGVIRLSASCNHETASILIENSFDAESSASLKTGLGLENIRQRLNTRYGEKATITVRDQGANFLVELRFPAERNGATS